MGNIHSLQRFRNILIACVICGYIILIIHLHGKQANKAISLSTITNKYTTERRQYSRPGFMTIHHPEGQLGNQMFQIAALLGLASITNHIPFLHAPLPDLDLVFDLPAGMHRHINASDFEVITEGEASILNEHDGYQYLMKNLSLDGYFQLFKLFNNIEPRVRHTFKFKPLLVKSARKYIEASVPATHVKVGVHVRRGDAVSMYQQMLGRTTPGKDYYKRAMDFYRSQHQNVTFIVVSDDKPWCRHHLITGSRDTLLSPFNHKGSDLALLTLCDHTVMSVGTFGWWGAWLAGGTVVYYGNQYRPGTELDRWFVRQDYYPQHWIRM